MSQPNPTPPAEVDVAELRALLERVQADSPLPWKRQHATVNVPFGNSTASAYAGTTDHAELILQAVNYLPALLTAAEQVASLRRALGWFVDDERFDVAVGGNPNVVEPMIGEAQRIYRSAPGAAP